MRFGRAGQALSALDPVAILDQLEAASRVADGYLRGRVTLPLVAPYGKDLVQAVCKLAAYELLGNRGLDPETEQDLSRSHKEATSWLKDIASGTATPEWVDSSEDGALGFDGDYVVAPTPDAEGALAVGVTGDFSGLEDLRRRLSAVGSEGVRRQVFQACAAEAEKLLDDEFQSSTDPYGNPWAPLTSRLGKPLLDTGAHLRGSLHAKVTATGFEVTTPFVGAAVHQYGATITPKNGEVLAFTVRGAPTKRSPRGKPSKVFARSVKIPKRQYMPEGSLPPRWAEGFFDATTLVFMNVLGNDV
jgi:phage gp36-like protein/phage gpG-like protein